MTNSGADAGSLKGGPTYSLRKKKRCRFFYIGSSFRSNVKTPASWVKGGIQSRVVTFGPMQQSHNVPVSRPKRGLLSGQKDDDLDLQERGANLLVSWLLTEDSLHVSTHWRHADMRPTGQQGLP